MCVCVVPDCVERRLIAYDYAQAHMLLARHPRIMDLTIKKSKQHGKSLKMRHVKVDWGKVM